MRLFQLTGAIFGLTTIAICSFLPVMGATAKEVVIQLSAYPDAIVGSSSPWVVAFEKGFFKDDGIELTIRGSAGGSADVRALLAGGLPYVETAVPAVIAAIQQGADIKMVSETVGGFTSTVWIANGNSPLNSIRDIKGKRLGASTPQGPFHMLSVMMVKKLGLSPSDVTMVATNGMAPQVVMLEGGGIDAATISVTFVNNAPEGKYKIIGRVRDELPNVANSVGITIGSAIGENGDTIRKLLAGRRKGLEFIRAHQDEAMEILSRRAKVPVESVRKNFEYLTHASYWLPGGFDTAGMDNFVVALKDIGALTGDVDWRGMVDQQFLPNDLKISLK